MFYKTILTIAYLPFKLLFPFKATGIENLPEGRVVVAGNHSSNADSVMVLMSMPWDGKTRIIGKKELFKLKIMNWFLRKMGAFPVDRGEADIDAVKECLSTLKNDGRLLIFPEGTRVKEDAVAAKTGAVVFAMRTKSPILPVYITKGKKLFRRTKVIFGQPYTVENTRDRELVEKYTTEMMDKIYALGEK